jgi:hypothetical protein
MSSPSTSSSSSAPVAAPAAPAAVQSPSSATERIPPSPSSSSLSLSRNSDTVSGVLTADEIRVVPDRLLDGSSAAPVSPRDRATTEAQMERETQCIIDRFGFMREGKDARPVGSQHLVEETTEQRKARVAVENRRMEKWTDMLFGDLGKKDAAMMQLSGAQAEKSQVAHWQRVLKKKHKKIKSRVRKGIPEALRGQVWQLLSESRLFKWERRDGYYNQLINSTVAEDVETQIHKDVVRTFQRHILFKRDDAIQRNLLASLTNVLRAYARHDPLVIYCQSMCSLVALFLMFCDEEEAFWLLCALSNPEGKYALRMLWAPGMPLVHTYFYVFSRLLEKHVPRVAKHFDQFPELALPASYEGTQWFTSIFVSSSIPFNFVLRIWDCFLSEGMKIVFRVGLAMMIFFEKDLLVLGDGAEVIEFLQGAYRTLDPDVILPIAFDIPLTRRQISDYAIEYEKSRLAA